MFETWETCTLCPGVSGARDWRPREVKSLPWGDTVTVWELGLKHRCDCFQKPILTAGIWLPLLSVLFVLLVNIGVNTN